MKTLFLSLLLTIPLISQAETAIQFNNQELNAAFVLVRPELNQIEINGRTGVFTPAPAMKFFGIEEQKFDIDLGTLVDLADLEFYQVKSKKPTVNFKNGTLEFTVPVQDQARAVQSRLGSISLAGVSLTAIVGWVTRADGSQRLAVKYVRFDGTLTGTGVLQYNFVLNKFRNLLANALNQLISGFLDDQKVQASIQTGLLTWAKFYTGTEFHAIIPGSEQFFQNAEGSGIQFLVE